jgi:hypothetical protein
LNFLWFFLDAIDAHSVIGPYNQKNRNKRAKKKTKEKGEETAVFSANGSVAEIRPAKTKGRRKRNPFSPSAVTKRVLYNKKRS